MQKNKLLQLEDKLHELVEVMRGGEPLNPLYKKDKEVLRMFNRAMLNTEFGMKEYFSGLFKRTKKSINTKKYKKLTADELNYDFIDVNWDEENILIQATLTESLIESIVAGGMFAEKMLNIDIGFGSANEEAIKFLRNYTIELAGELSNTTIDRINESIKTALSLGENQKQMTARLDLVINDERRAAMIARTESVRSFASGGQIVAKEIGCDRKRWNANYKACPICQELNNKTVKLNEEYEKGIMSPPRHPSCLCIQDYLLPKQK